MIFLSIDTSTRFSVVSLSCGFKIIAGKKELFQGRRCESLEKLVSDVLAEADLSITSVDRFALGVGPGSFTGLRIGISFMKAICYGLSKPCYVFSSLDAIAYNPIKHMFRDVVVLVDAKCSRLYYRVYKAIAGREKMGSTAPLLKPSGPESLLTVKDVLLKIKGKKISVVGDGFVPYQESLLSAADGVDVIGEEFWSPSVESLHLSAMTSFKNKLKTDALKLNANYLYKADCQVRKPSSGKLRG